MNNIIEKAKSTHDLSEFEILSLLQNDSINELLFKAADDIREKYLGNMVHLRGLIEFTNICKRNCMYCG
ncbi:MAG: [FeFe] hydrogenase H-cluster radical SAM maturase HydE, partial [Clostridium butyricum]